VRTVNKIAGLARRADVYWVWWPTSGAPAVLLARLLRRPVILVTAISENDTTPSGLRAKPPWTRALGRAVLRLADLTLATSDDTRGRAGALPHAGAAYGLPQRRHQQETLINRRSRLPRQACSSRRDD